MRCTTFMKSLKQTYLIHATPERVWNALTNPKEIDGWGAGPAKMDDNVGTKFTLWSGDIYGKNIEVIKHKKLVQEWYAGKWAVPSIVTFILRSKGNKTEATLVHTNIPDSEYKDIEEGWKSYYMVPLKEYIEKKHQ